MPRGLQLLGHGGVGELAEHGGAIGDERLQERAAVFAIGIDGGCHGVEAIGIGGADDGAAVVVAEGEGIGDGVVVRQVGARVVAHGEHGVVGVDGKARSDEAIHRAVVPALVLRNPVVRDVVGAGGVGLRGVEVEGQKHAGGRTGGVAGIGLIESRARVGESADAAIAAEVVIEGAIFLDEDDDVIDVGDFGAGGGRTGRSGYGGASAATVEQGAGKACCSGCG